jgi:hypothetical protein
LLLCRIQRFSSGLRRYSIKIEHLASAVRTYVKEVMEGFGDVRGPSQG